MVVGETTSKRERRIKKDTIRSWKQIQLHLVEDSSACKQKLIYLFTYYITFIIIHNGFGKSPSQVSQQLQLKGA